MQPFENGDNTIDVSQLKVVDEFFLKPLKQWSSNAIVNGFYPESGSRIPMEARKAEGRESDKSQRN
jgi:hypothetical protein